MSKRGLATTVAVGLLTACTTPANMPKATIEQQQEAQELIAKDKMARLYVLNGLQRSLLFERDYHTPADYFINSINVCSLNAGEYFKIDLPPGDYTIMWRQRSSDPLAAKGAPTPLVLHPDEVLFLRSVEDVRAMQKGGLWGGAIGVIASTASTNPLLFEACPETCPPLIRQKTLVVADAAAVAQLSAPVAADAPASQAASLPAARPQ